LTRRVLLWAMEARSERAGETERGERTRRRNRGGEE